MSMASEAAEMWLAKLRDPVTVERFRRGLGLPPSKGLVMNNVYSIKIKRGGMADLPELVSTEDIEKAVAVVRYLLLCDDPRVQEVIISVVRV